MGEPKTSCSAREGHESYLIKGGEKDCGKKTLGSSGKGGNSSSHSMGGMYRLKEENGEPLADSQEN